MMGTGGGFDRAIAHFDSERVARSDLDGAGNGIPARIANERKTAFQHTLVRKAGNKPPSAVEGLARPFDPPDESCGMPAVGSRKPVPRRPGEPCERPVGQPPRHLGQFFLPAHA